MKFGESLVESLVPEWKDQYVDYKAGKKQIKRATELYNDLRGLNTTDLTPLLNPLADDRHYNGPVPQADLGPLALDPVENGSSRRRPSIFNLSMKSTKNKKEEFYEERAKFSRWINEELDMVNNFYIEKEKEIYERFLVLEDQFFQLKEHRMKMVLRSAELAQQRKIPVANVNVTGWAATAMGAFRALSRYDLPSLPSATFLRKLLPEQKTDKDVHLKSRKTNDEAEYYPNYRENQIRNGEIIYESDDELIASSSLSRYQGAVLQLQPEQTPEQAAAANRRDYIASKHYGVPYLYARKQLKSALIEHYRSISLLKSYKVLNRTALRKITKKMDKAVHTSICLEFMHKVDKETYFQTSDALEKISSRIEDLFLTYYDHEASDRKHGLEKLRSATYAYNNADIRLPLYYKAVFFSGISLGVGFPLFIVAIYNALDQTITGQLPEGKLLLQIWGGFFLLNLALLLIGINFVAFHKFKINYKFIFEFNLATALDYKQFFLLPSIGFGLLGLLGWFSFQNYWPNTFPGRDFPLIYLAICLIIFLWPGKQLYPASRKWLQITLWRALLSGFYPVEFRDFSAGDFFCSLTYSMGNISFFFCIYARDWKNLLGGGLALPDSRCGSNHSELMGFFATLPSIWRFLQCVRRFMDSGDAFPHLANMVKYLIGVVYYCLLSLWRIHRLESYRVSFIVFACFNSILCSTWDIIMDWSLGQTNSKHFLLRDNLFFGKPEYYYTAICVNVILRFQWIFYAFFSNQIQQLAVTSFAIAVAEIVRRFIWFFFRLENEHCTNVTLFRASRDSPLPYSLTTKVERAIKKLVVARYEAHTYSDSDFEPEAVVGGAEQPAAGESTAYSGSAAGKHRDEESTIGRRRHHDKNKPEPPARRSTLSTISDALNKAHIKDFQRKKMTVPVEESDEEDDDDDDFSDNQSVRRAA